MTAAATLESIRAEFPHGVVTRETTWTGSLFVSSLVAVSSPHLVVEVGCCNGATSAYICDVLRNLGQGRFVGYEQEPYSASAAESRLSSVWPDGAWEIVTGDFFETYRQDSAGFAFIDIDPKEDYVRAYETLKLDRVTVVVAHDLDFDMKNVGNLIPFLVRDGFEVSQIHRERGFIVGVRG